jgi:hypothetical protein
LGNACTQARNQAHIVKALFGDGSTLRRKQLIPKCQTTIRSFPKQVAGRKKIVGIKDYVKRGYRKKEKREEAASFINSCPRVVRQKYPKH